MTVWEFDKAISLSNNRISSDDGVRQQVTAAEICDRLNKQPGVVLADDVGMGKTFVALAVAASIVSSNPGSQVVVMVPSAVAKKWPKDWTVFRDSCLPKHHSIRATAETIRDGSEFLKLLDDPPSVRKHIIFLTHIALRRNLTDPFIQLAIIQNTFKRHRSLSSQAQAFPSIAKRVFSNKHFSPDVVRELLDANTSRWKDIWNSAHYDIPLDDNPVPRVITESIRRVKMTAVKDALMQTPIKYSAGFNERIKLFRQNLRSSTRDVWRQTLQDANLNLPLLVLDEAHHLKNPNTLRNLFDNSSSGENESSSTALGDVFERMLFLTATPFQLGHEELIRVIRLFQSTRDSAELFPLFEQHVNELSSKLDRAKGASLRLDSSWSHLSDAEARSLASLDSDSRHDSDTFKTALACFTECSEKVQVASASLRPWVIRHTKAKNRQYLPGRSTIPEAPATTDTGLEIDRSNVLPFLLATRAQALVSLRGAEQPARSRALFAEGLASSFEAYLSTRGRADEISADIPSAPGEEDAEISWYLDEIERSLTDSDSAIKGIHPKISATVRRTQFHWSRGEKVLIFCFYKATGKALQTHVAKSLEEWVVNVARLKFGFHEKSNEEILEKISERTRVILSAKSPGTRRLEADVVGIASDAGLDRVDARQLGEITRRFMQIPTFAVRYIDLLNSSTASAVGDALSRPDTSGITFSARLREFALRVATMTLEEKDSLWKSLEEIGVSKVTSSIIPLVNGETKPERRARVVDVFNSPFPPDVLISSAVMSEGVDLHRDCQHVIHHDLDWNPSNLEQRTGRVDRIGSKSELSKTPIVVCEPFIAGTQDERQYRVVKDRERWFGVVMGGQVPEQEFLKDKIAQRAALPESLVKQLTIDLSVWPQLSHSVRQI